jgi:methyltransferase, FkbM family
MIHQYNYYKIENNYEILKGKKVIIWCRSITALQIYKVLRNCGIEVIGFTDSFANRPNEMFAGIPVYTFEEIANMGNTAIYIATNVYQYQQEILEQTSRLKNADVYTTGDVYGAGLFDIAHMKQAIKKADNKIRYIRENLADERSREVFDRLIEYRVTNDRKRIPEIYEREHAQYFPTEDWIRLKDEEVFVDAGAHDGSTSLDFCNWTKGRYSKIYMMEPDPLMFEIMKEYAALNKMDHVVPIQSGAYSFTGELRFEEDSATGSSRITEAGETVIRVVSIDDMLKGEKATFIKMDIEGAEMEALLGAKKTIEKYKPRLAVSVYHKADDLWEIPYYVLSHYPTYKIYLRHYALTTNETVMYAV